jgi:alanine dehydrogenase
MGDATPARVWLVAQTHAGMASTIYTRPFPAPVAQGIERCPAEAEVASSNLAGRTTAVPLYLTESDVAELLTPEDALGAVEGSFRRLAAGEVVNRPRYRLPLEEGSLAVMAAVDGGLGYAGVKTYAGFATGARFVVCLFRADAPELVALIEADRLGQLRTGAASGVAARHLARPGASSLGVIGAGWQAETQIACIRAALPGIDRVRVYARDRKRLETFCRKVRAEPAESNSEAADADVVVTVTTSRDPVLRGEWLREGALVCAVGANVASKRELDNVVLERAAFVCCDSLEDAKLESGDLIEPVAVGVLDWLEVHELQEVVAGDVAGRADPEDIVVFKSNGLAAWDVAIGAAAFERARERGVGLEL